MKVNRLEAHDRLLSFKEEQAINIFQGAEDCLKRTSLSLALQAESHYVYLFAHPRTADDGITKVMYWQPRLTKPEVQENSYLFRAKSHSDEVECIWFLPPKEIWKQFDKGNMLEADHISVSIWNYKNKKRELQRPHEDDLPEEKIRDVYRKMSFKPNPSAASLSLPLISSAE